MIFQGTHKVTFGKHFGTLLNGRDLGPTVAKALLPKDAGNILILMAAELRCCGGQTLATIGLILLA